jgi:hypothetical protein
VASEQRRRLGPWLYRAIGLLVAGWVLVSDPPPGVEVRLPVALVLAASSWLVLDMADHRDGLHQRSWPWLALRLASPYVAFVALLTLTGTEEGLSLGMALLFGVGFAALFPGPIVIATFVRVRRDRAKRK